MAVAIQVPLTDVPWAPHRRAARYLKERGSGPESDWQYAQLGDHAIPLFEPGRAEPSYFEFPVSLYGEPAGSIMVSTGAHDEPVVGSNAEGEAETAVLAREAQDAGHTVHRMYLVRGVIVGEDALGQQVVSSGDLPPYFEPPPGGFPADVEPVGMVDELVVSDDQPDSDYWYLDVISTEAPTGALTPAPKDWSDWSELKMRYDEVYGHARAQLATEVEPLWEDEAYITDGGELVLVGETRWVSILQRDFQYIELREGGEWAHYEVAEYEGQATDIKVTFDGHDGHSGPVPVELVIHYGAGSEIVRFFIAASIDAPSDSTPPTVAGAATTKRGRSGPHRFINVVAEPDYRVDGTARNWTEWEMYFPGVGRSTRRTYDGDLVRRARSQQVVYAQLRRGERYNPHSCSTGCGPMAWTLYGAWVDRMADQNDPTWRNTTGIYRFNARVADAANDVPGPASLAMTSGGDKARRMIGSISAAMGSLLSSGCTSGGSRWTHPIDMEDFRRYLRSRSLAGAHTRRNDWLHHTHSSYAVTRDRIIYGDRPVIVGFHGRGGLHYGLAFGLERRQRRYAIRAGHREILTRDIISERLHVNNGWARSTTNFGVRSLASFFQGWLSPAGLPDSLSRGPENDPGRVGTGGTRTRVRVQRQ